MNWRGYIHHWQLSLTVHNDGRASVTTHWKGFRFRAVIHSFIFWHSFEKGMPKMFTFLWTIKSKLNRWFPGMWSQYLNWKWHQNFIWRVGTEYKLFLTFVIHGYYPQFSLQLFLLQCYKKQFMQSFFVSQKIHNFLTNLEVCTVHWWCTASEMLWSNVLGQKWTIGVNIFPFF